MDLPFIYNSKVTGKNFIGRRNDCIILSNLLLQGEHMRICGTAKSGKGSLIQQTFYDMKAMGKAFTCATADLSGVRTYGQFIKAFCESIIRSVASTPMEYAELVRNYFRGTHIVFDSQAYSDRDEIISFNWDIDANDISASVRFPFLISKHRCEKLFIVMNEFQNLEFTENPDLLYDEFTAAISESRMEIEKPYCSFLFSGSRVNAMNAVFTSHRLLKKLVEPFTITPFDEKDIIEYITRGMLASGKVVDRDLLFGVCKLFRNNMWYINHFMSICDHLSKGYIMEPILLEALQSIIAIHEPRFHAIMSDLTTFQVNFLEAILDGHKKFSSADVIRQYSLSSSANVKRLKDALMKKEIISFDQNDEPYVLDPLFEYWARKYYYKKKVEQ